MDKQKVSMQARVPSYTSEGMKLYLINSVKVPIGEKE